MKKAYIIVIMLALVSTIGICSFSGAKPMSPCYNNSDNEQDSATIIGQWRGVRFSQYGVYDEDMTQLIRSSIYDFKENGIMFWIWEGEGFEEQEYTLVGRKLIIEEGEKEYIITTLTANKLVLTRPEHEEIAEYERVSGVPTPHIGTTVMDTLIVMDTLTVNDTLLVLADTTYRPDTHINVIPLGPDTIHQVDTLVVNITKTGRPPQIGYPPRRPDPLIDSTKVDRDPPQRIPPKGSIPKKKKPEGHTPPTPENNNNGNGGTPNPSHRKQTHAPDTVVVTDGLYCYFDFDNEEIVDWKGRFTGINNGTTTSTDSPSGKGRSREFKGESFILVKDNIVPARKPFSINIWFKTDTINQALVGSDSHGGGNKQSSLWIMNNSRFRYTPNHNIDGWTTNGDVTQYLDNQWHMVTITFDSKIAMMYIDGTFFESKNSTYMIWGSNVNESYFGADLTQSLFGFFKGKLDNFRSYDRALSESEIQTIYKAKQ